MYRVITGTEAVLIQDAIAAYERAVDAMEGGQPVSILNEHTGTVDQGGIISAKLGYMRRFARPAG